MAFPVDYADAQLGACIGALVFEGRTLPPYAADWLLQGLLRALRQGIPVDQALGLSGPGLEPLALRIRRMQRDLHLADAALAVTLDDGLSLWARCKRLAPLVKQFETRLWSRAAVQHLQAPLSDWPIWQCHVFLAFRTGLSVPSSASGLNERLAKTPHFSPNTSTATVLARFL